MQFSLTGEHPEEFSIALRIPGWAGPGASMLVNDKPVPDLIAPGSFLSVHRKWKNGDRILLRLPMSLRLEAVDEQHPDTVALLYGPLVLFAVDAAPPSVTRSQLLAAYPKDRGEWAVNTAGGSLRLLPFQAIGETQYSTYFKVV